MEIFTWFMCVCLYVVGGTDSGWHRLLKSCLTFNLKEVCEVSLIVINLLFFSVRYYYHLECSPSRL